MGCEQLVQDSSLHFRDSLPSFADHTCDAALAVCLQML